MVISISGVESIMIYRIIMIGRVIMMVMLLKVIITLPAGDSALKDEKTEPVLFVLNYLILTK